MIRFPVALKSALLVSAAMFAVAPGTGHAQDVASDPAATPPPEAGNQAGAVTGQRIFSPADFARFAPKTAYDMLKQVPGFTIRSPEEYELDRGLGQATENVLINGRRIANKTGGAVDQLKQLPAGAVERIEILDAASLGIAGLSGQVANIVVKAERKAGGQFEWRPNARAHFTKPELLGGSISYSGQRGPVDYTLTAKNNFGRGGFGGPIVLSNASGATIETRDEIYQSEYEEANLEAKFAIDAPGSSLANVTIGYIPYWNPSRQSDTRLLASGETRNRSTKTKLNGYNFNLNGDYELALGPGRLKLIGLRHFEHEPLVSTQVLRFDSGAPSQGIRLDRDIRIGETIARAEYGWKGGVNDWQLSAERAFNSLDQRGRLFELTPAGAFEEVEFDNGTGKVVETRYEGIATLSRPLGSRLDLQVAAGAETSELDRVDDDQAARRFFRPKGSISLAWRPAAGWDASLKLRRKVGQISFYDFLTQPKLTTDRENEGNPDLVPPQSWEAETEIGRELGRWGKTRLRTWYHRVEDIVDVIPIGDDGEGIGNLPRASRMGFESVSTLNFDPLGLVGAKLDITVGSERTRVRDPLTGERRPISGVRTRWASFNFRHDIAGTPLAWGGYADYGKYARYYFPTEVYRSWEGPWWVGVFVEHKNVRGLTVRADLGNILDARHYYDRTRYTGRRTVSPVDFVQYHDQLIGPIFDLSVRGTF